MGTTPVGCVLLAPAFLPRSLLLIHERVSIQLLFRLPIIQLRLAAMRGFGGIHSRLHLSLLKEVPPTLMSVGRDLAFFILLHRGLCVLLALDDFHYARGLIRPDVMANDEVGITGFFACQSGSVWGMFRQLGSRTTFDNLDLIRVPHSRVLCEKMLVPQLQTDALTGSASPRSFGSLARQALRSGCESWR
jgi:hypothetical protein